MYTWTCTYCDRENLDSQRSCPGCGAPKRHSTTRVLDGSRTPVAPFEFWDAVPSTAAPPIIYGGGEYPTVIR